MQQVLGRILILNGPNLNLLGLREPEHYGSLTLKQLLFELEQEAMHLHLQLEHLQTNVESEYIERVHAARSQVDFLILNPASWTHTSIALRDALLGVGLPFIEVHLSNLAARESFRQISFFSDIAVGVISGLGWHGYRFAMQYAAAYLKKQAK